MTPEQAKALREPFPDSHIRKLPRVTCKACRESQTKNCQQHNKINCQGCGNFITSAHIHLDYVDHAAVTDRLLSVDPDWTWEPVATDPNTGAPVVDHYVGLWIRLTVCGVTRLGYGDAEGKKGADAVKEAISTAIRNAAMRFGVALDLWSKVDLHSEPDDTPANPDPEPRPEVPTTPPGQPPAPAEQAAPRKTPEQYREALLSAEDKTTVRHLLRDISMDGMADTETADAKGEALTFAALATSLMKALP